jgi:hypothetical protein
VCRSERRPACLPRRHLRPEGAENVSGPAANPSGFSARTRRSCYARSDRTRPGRRGTLLTARCMGSQPARRRALFVAFAGACTGARQPRQRLSCCKRTGRRMISKAAIRHRRIEVRIPPLRSSRRRSPRAHRFWRSAGSGTPPSDRGSWRASEEIHQLAYSLANDSRRELVTDVTQIHDATRRERFGADT